MNSRNIPQIFQRTLCFQRFCNLSCSIGGHAISLQFEPNQRTAQAAVHIKGQAIQPIEPADLLLQHLLTCAFADSVPLPKRQNLLRYLLEKAGSNSAKTSKLNYARANAASSSSGSGTRGQLQDRSRNCRAEHVRRIPAISVAPSAPRFVSANSGDYLPNCKRAVNMRFETRSRAQMSLGNGKYREDPGSSDQYGEPENFQVGLPRLLPKRYLDYSMRLSQGSEHTRCTRYTGECGTLCTQRWRARNGTHRSG